MTPMRQAEKPVFHADRTPIDFLNKGAPLVLETLRQLDTPRIKDKDNNIQFCGLIHAPKIGSHMFLPMSAICDGNENENLEIAKLTMQALARYGAETSKKEFDDLGEKGNAGALAIIRWLTDDFRENGLFSERTRIQTRNSGKPDWMRTVKRETGIPNRKGQPIFTDIRTSRPVRSNGALLTQIQAAILREILKLHGWWLRGGFSAKSQLVTCPDPPFRRSVWARKLESLFPTLYSDRSIRLAKNLRDYLRQSSNSSSGPMIFGVRDFFNVWEAILRETIVRSRTDPKLNWNSRLPKPVYLLKNGLADRRDGMRTDIILQHDISNYTIIDAKYYAATTAKNAPGWADIGKQMLYEKALIKAVEEEHGITPEIRNVFAFPSGSGDGTLERVEMRFDGRTGTVGGFFFFFYCVYISVQIALDCYVARKKEIFLDFQTTSPAPSLTGFQII